MTSPIDDNGIGNPIFGPLDFTPDQWEWIQANHPKRVWGLPVTKLSAMDRRRNSRWSRFLTALLFGSPFDRVKGIPAFPVRDPREWGEDE